MREITFSGAAAADSHNSRIANLPNEQTKVPPKIEIQIVRRRKEEDEEEEMDASSRLEIEQFALQLLESCLDEALCAHSAADETLREAFAAAKVGELCK